MKAGDYVRLLSAACVLPLLAQAPSNQVAQPAQPAQQRPPQQRLSESTGINLFSAHCTQCHGIVPVERAPTEATTAA